MEFFTICQQVVVTPQKFNTHYDNKKKDAPARRGIERIVVKLMKIVMSRYEQLGFSRAQRELEEIALHIRRDGDHFEWKTK